MSLQIVNRQFLHFDPLAVAFPNAKGEGKADVSAQGVLDRLADILYGRIFEKVIQGLVIEPAQRFFDRIFQLGKVHEHSGLLFALDDDLDLIGVAVQRSALVVTRKIVRAIDVVDDSQPHRISLPARLMKPHCITLGVERCTLNVQGPERAAQLTELGSFVKLPLLVADSPLLLPLRLQL